MLQFYIIVLLIQSSCSKRFTDLFCYLQSKLPCTKYVLLFILTIYMIGLETTSDTFLEEPDRTKPNIYTKGVQLPTTAMCKLTNVCVTKTELWYSCINQNQTCNLSHKNRTELLLYQVKFEVCFQHILCINYVKSFFAYSLYQ